MLVAFHDPLLVLASFLVLLVLVLAARAAGSLHAPGSGVRRALHAAVGLWTAFVTTRFHHLGWALVPPVVFLALNASGKTGRLVPALDREGDPGAARGLWTFPLGVALVYVLFWNDPARAPILAGCLVLALADPAAAWAGSRLGQRRLRPLRLRRTLEGSLVFFLVASVAAGWVAAELMSGYSTARVLRLGIGCAAAGAVAEAFSPSGWDNAAIPLAVAAAYGALS